jgi:hypothetical protein
MVKHETTSRIAEFTKEPKQLVHEYPLSSTLVVFGVGLGAGLLLSSILAEPVRLMSHHETSSERMQRQMMEALKGILPASLMQRCSS